MEEVIIDCDNTFGLGGKDIDDGLTLLYLIGAQLELAGITLTYGNAGITEVAQATKQFLTHLNVETPVYLGAHNSRNRLSPASQFLAERVANHPQKITIIATGALTNLLGAAHYNPDFFKQVKKIIIMGGILKPLVINGQRVKELNFSCDPEATQAVLVSEAPLVIMNGHLTAQAYFPRDLIKGLMGNRTQNQWLSQVMHSWCDWNLKHLGMDGFCNWDMTTAIYLEKPELFSNESVWLSPQQNLTTGIMRLSSANHGKLVTMPERLDAASFNERMLTTIGQVLQK